MTKEDVVQTIVGAPPWEAASESSAFASANIALCKYWGKRNDELNLPINSSLSVSLRDRGTRVNLQPADEDALVINGERLDNEAPVARRLFAYLDLFRPRPDFAFRVETSSTVPIGAGLASSASAFAAVVRALDGLFNWQLSGRDLSVLARLGSGSACRSIYHGFVEWHAGSDIDGMDSFAEPLPDHWPALRVGLLTLNPDPKQTGSREGMRRTRDESVLFRAWPEKAAEDLAEIRTAIHQRDFTRLGETAESNALSMHATMLGCRPALLYWLPDSVAAIHKVTALRANDLAVYLTMDAGPNVKLLFLESDEVRVHNAFPDLSVVAPFAP